MVEKATKPLIFNGRLLRFIGCAHDFMKYSNDTRQENCTSRDCVFRFSPLFIQNDIYEDAVVTVIVIVIVI